jgi:hypothetical protein
VPDEIDRPAARDQIGRQIRQVFGGQVIWGEELMELAVGGGRVTVS